MANEALRHLPSVDRLISTPQLSALAAEHNQALVVEATRAVLQDARAEILRGGAVPGNDALAAMAVERVRKAVEPTLRRVINATGVIIHTNLGRAPLSDAARRAMMEVSAGYTNLEYDLDAGGRGSRYDHATDLLRRLTDAEAALVVNNNAAAVLLVLSALARGRELIISRSQLVEIGGGFRIPDVMTASGAGLVEVGTTNRTYIEDYAAAIGERTVGLLMVHSSNFRIVGFTHEASLAEMVGLAHERGLLVIYDLGSGALLDTQALGIGGEPTVTGAVQAGADIVCFSGDKLLGGPQAGLIVGRADLIGRLSHFPMTRALRVDKSTLAALQATLLSYLRGKATTEIPIWRMITTPISDLQARAEGWAQALGGAGARAQVVSGESTVGGGSLPGEEFATRLLALEVASPQAVSARLRAGTPPVVCRIEADRLLFDPRTVLPEQDVALLDAILSAIA